MSGDEIKQEPQYQFKATQEVVPGSSYGVVSKNNAQKLPQDNPTLYVEVPAKQPKEGETFSFDLNNLFILAAIAELYRALGPTNGAPKYRVKADAAGNPIALLSKMIKGFQQLTKIEWEYRDTLEDIMIPAAAHFALMYLFEEADLNQKNIDINKNIRIDFDIAFVDYFGRAPGVLDDFTKTFSGKRFNTRFFAIHPTDLKIFPNMVIAKPWNLLFFQKQLNRAHIEKLNEVNDSLQFNKIVHQYFLKSLLFGKELLRPILSAHIKDGNKVEEFENYIDARFNSIKIALVQVPQFRENVIEHFKEYKANILDEIKAHNQQFEGHQNPDKEKYYAGRIIDQKQIEIKLDQLHHIICACETASKNNNQFAAFRTQISLAANGVQFNDDELLALVDKQVVALEDHLKVCTTLTFEQVLSQYLKHVRAVIKQKSLPACDKAEILFYVDRQVSECLIRQERSCKILNDNDAYNYLIEAYTNDIVNGVSLFESFEWLPEKWHQTEDMNCFKNVMTKLNKKESIAVILNENTNPNFYDVNINILRQFSEAQTAAKTNNIKTAIDNLNSFDKLYEVIQDDNLDAIEYRQYLNFPDKIIFKKDFYNNLLELLDQCIDYADHMDNKKLAILYRDYVNSLYGFLEEGISKQHPPENIVANIMNAIKNSGAEFSEHRGIKGLLDALKDLIYQLICFDSSATTKPWISTQRVALLEKVNEACAVVWPRLDG